MSVIAHNLKTSKRLRTRDIATHESLNFKSLMLSKSIIRGLTDSGFVTPSPIQVKAIPLGKCGLDLVVQAKSGTGKTCVFAVIALESLRVDVFSLQVLILAPTREIAIQIRDSIRVIGKYFNNLECHAYIGGVGLVEDKHTVNRCQIAVATPGRITHLIKEKIINVDSVRLFVMDEADKLLESEFQEQINWLYSILPNNKQTLALSATYPESLAQHLKNYMRDPTYIRLNRNDPALLGICQYYCTVPPCPLPNKVFSAKCEVLIQILSSVTFTQCLVFSNYQTRAQSLCDTLNSHGWPTTIIAGSLDQKTRTNAMNTLKTFQCRILVTTDLTSRGIDAEQVNLIINLDLPPDTETYLHRIGRAGRYGTCGAAISLVAEGTELSKINDIETHCKSTILILPDPLPHDLVTKHEKSVDLATDVIITTTQPSPDPPSTLSQDIKKLVI